MIAFRIVVIKVIEQNLPRLLIGICKPKGFDILSYFKKKEPEVLTTCRKHRNPNETAEEFMKGLCEFKGLLEVIVCFCI